MRGPAAVAVALSIAAVGCARSHAVPAGAGERFARANARYEQGDFEGAARGYVELIEAGVEDATLDYDLGCALARTGRYGLAVLAFRRAMLFDPRLDDARENLAWVRARLADKQPPDPPFPAFLWRTAALVPLRTGLALALLFDWLAAAALGWSSIDRDRPARARRLRGAALALAAAALLLGAGPVVRLQRLATDTRAVVIAERAEARSGPGAANPVLFTVHRGFEVEIGRREGAFVRVRAAGGLAGWLPAEAIAAVAPGDDPAAPFRDLRGAPSAPASGPLATPAD